MQKHCKQKQQKGLEQRKNRNIVNMAPSTMKETTLLVGNVNRETTHGELRELFNQFGPVKRCAIVKEPKNKNSKTTIAYVTYSSVKDAEAALDALQGAILGESKIKLKVLHKGESQKREEENDNNKDEHFVNKRARVIVRNLSFKVTEESLTKHFEQFGKIEEVNILYKPDGKLVGCAFIQFAKVKSAQKAMEECNAKEFLGRPVAVDWALPKSKFCASSGQGDSESGIKKEKVTVKEEPMEEEETVERKVIKKEEEDDDEEERDRDYEEGDEDTENNHVRSTIKREVTEDVSEGRTVFIKNLSYDTTSEGLKEFLSDFGKVLYAVVCMDPVTEHSRGTAFAKFQDTEEAEKCIAASQDNTNPLMLDGRRLDVLRAMSRNDLTKKIESEKEVVKDNRNLYLAREGVIQPGTKAAEGVSAADLTKRLQVEQWKKQMLRNLNMFVAKNRLVIHNLPLGFSDKQLKKLLLKYSGPGAKTTEARVMRDLKDVDARGVGKSKGFGFVTFVRHENALQALRNLNNNPNIFSKLKRPIVSFSIENKAVMKTKERRLQKSLEKNPMYNKDSESSKGKKNLGKKTSSDRLAAPLPEDVPSYGGSVSDPKVRPDPAKMWPKSKHQVRQSMEALSKQKPKKITRRMLKRQRRFRQKNTPPLPVALISSKAKGEGKEVQRKNQKKRVKDYLEEKQFNKLVDNYKQKLLNVPTTKQKWYT